MKGGQQARDVWASVGSFHQCLWTFTMTEVWAWDRDGDDLVSHRRESPGDNEPRRPSRADKCRALRWEFLTVDFEAGLRAGTDGERIPDLAGRLLDLAA